MRYPYIPYLFCIFIMVLLAMIPDAPKHMHPAFNSVTMPDTILNKDIGIQKFTNFQTEVYRFLMSSKNIPSYCHPIPFKLTTAYKDSLIDCSLPYVTIDDGGRLGSQISQFSSLWILREIFGIRVTISHKLKRSLSKVFQDIKMPSLTKDCFPPWDKKVRYRQLYLDLFENETRIQKLKNSSSTQMKLLGQSLFVSGSAVPHDLMWLYRDKLRNELLFKASIINKANAKITDTLRALGTCRENVTLVTVHARRTDYKGWLKANYDTELIGEEYFIKAFNFYRERLENPVFLVTSDDPKWCRQHLLNHDVAIAATPNPAVDMAISSLGDHHIVTYGTFGFCGALLGHGVITHPVNYSNKIAWQAVLLDCALGLNTILPINAQK